MNSSCTPSLYTPGKDAPADKCATFVIDQHGSLVMCRVKGLATEETITHIQNGILERVRNLEQGLVLYDCLEMHAPPVSVPLLQQQLDKKLGKIKLRRAIVVPDTKLAYLARLAFGDADYRVFYNDMEAAINWLHESLGLPLARRCEPEV